jgi:membrane-associated phospholipid phosphatase
LTRRVAAAVVGCLLFAAVAHAQAFGPDGAIRDALRLPSASGRTIADWTSTGLVVVALVVPCLHDRTWLCLANEGLQVGVSAATDELIKRLVHRRRPDLFDSLSFPSGHTNMACVVTLRTNAWALCPAVAALRIMADRHYASDVTAGVMFAVPEAWLRWKQ